MAEKDQGTKPTAVADTTKKAAAAAPATTPEAEKPKAKLAPAPELDDQGKRLVESARKELGGKFPTKDYPVKVAFGHEYDKGTYTDHTNERVQRLVWDLRQTSGKPSYRSIAEAIGIQCSAITEAVTHAYAKKAKVKDDSWKVNTGGRVKFLQEQKVMAEKADAPSRAV